ncbi:MAG: hypothetical protein J6S67_23130 [Methanobrevibacter sp.]|nr:hypothetical protein [Methanobrevibacter sp.]
MKNGVLRFIPLQADLCLNKQKVDIEDFKGWQKCNAPVYGDCLSPLYKKEDDHHDIYIGNDTYDWEDGALKKNGDTVWSGGSGHKLKKTKLTQRYDALAVTDSVQTWVKIQSGNTIQYSLHGASANTLTISNCTQIVATKAFENTANSIYGIACMYLHTNGKYGYMIMYNIGGTTYTKYGAGGVTTWDNFNVISPLIQVGVVGATKFIVSFFGSSGANLGATEVKNVYVDGANVYDNPLFSDTTSYPDIYGTFDANTDVSVKIETTSITNFTTVSQADSGSQGQRYKTGVNQQIEITMKAHPQPVTLTFMHYNYQGGVGIESLVFPASESNQTYIRTVAYWTGVQTSDTPDFSSYSSYYSLNITGAGDPVSISRSGTGLITPDVKDLSTASSLLILPAYQQREVDQFFVEISYKELTNANDTSAPLYNTPKSVRMYEDGLTLSNYSAMTRSTSGNTAWANYNEFALWGMMNRSLVQYGNTQDYITPSAFNPYYCSSFKFKWKYYGSGGTSVEPVTISFAVAPYYANGDPTASDNGKQYYNVIPTNRMFSFYNPIKRLYNEQALKEVDCCMDDGHLYCVGALSSDTENPLPKKMLALSGSFESFDPSSNTVSYTSDASLSIAYDLDEEENVFPKYYVGQTVSVQNYYLRIVYLFKAKKDDEENINIVVDNLAVAFGETPAHLLGGVQAGTNANLQGGVYNCPSTTDGDGWRLLFNNNILSNVGCYEKGSYIGTILADWFNVDGDFCVAFNKTQLYYKDNVGDIWKLEMITQDAEWDYRLVEDRYIVFNTTNYFNCYDTKTGVQRHWASDYNNRMLYGEGFSTYTNNAQFKALLEQERYSGLIITAQNANYEMTKDMITGLLLGAINYTGCLKDTVSFLSCEMPYGAIESIDLYRGDEGSTSALYVCSYSNKIKFVNNDLVNPYAVYPISENGDIQFNPNLFTMFIKSYNNKDMVISDGIAYRLVYFNNVVPVMAYYMLDGVEELIGAFVLQTSYYGVSESRLYQMNYSNGVGVEVVADITNMEYLGALPSQALFWSAQNRAIYSFKGNCIMALMQYANELTGIYGKWYNPATQELFLDTNIGILVFSDLGTYCLEWETETEGASVKDIFFFKDHFIVNLIDDTEYSYYYSYNNKEGYASNGIYIFTKYYGNGLVPITVNNVYVRLYNQSVANAEGSISFKGHTITDIGTQTDEKTVAIGGEDDPTANPPTVAGEEWDSPTDTMLVKYTPQYNRGLGFALEIHTTFPIIDIKFDYVENGSIESQIAHINI